MMNVGVPPSVDQGHAQVPIGIEPVGFRRDRRLDRLHRLIDPTALGHAQSEALQRVGVAWFQLESLAANRFGFGSTVLEV